MNHEKYMNRCLQLALSGSGYVAPNPMVGACLVHQERIIGEGWHRQFGGPHAEVNCLDSVQPADFHLIPESVLYITLEPCNHFGKTPPCTDLILKKGIKQVVVGCIDANAKVNGSGIQKLKSNGVEVTSGVLERECVDLNRRFFTFHQKKRPYIILKWAQTADGFIANPDGSTLKISNNMTDRLVHKWRSEEDAILVGTNTLLKDNPSLTTRLWSGKNPLRVVIDKELKADLRCKIYDGQSPVLVFNHLKSDKEGDIEFVEVDKSMNLIEQINQTLYSKNVLSLLVEGGARTLESYFHSGCWDEARIITNNALKTDSGIQAPNPQLYQHSSIQKIEKIDNDTIHFFRNTNSNQ
jgi:diaminohydroxyphosphoribosylaminopyrimidine deaminase/5-amino-6-(5-phosphoribosylamino)uracil reductase